MNRRIIALGSSICMTAALLVATQTATAPLAEAATTSPFSYSYYVNGTETGWAYNQGYSLGRLAYSYAGTQRFTTILDFGAMYLSGGTWKLSNWTSAGITLDVAGQMVFEFGMGFYAGVGTDHSSIVYIGLGTNSGGSQVNGNAGAALAAKVVALNKSSSSWYYKTVFFVGAIDFEGGWASGTADRNWFNGYMGYAGRPALFNYGSADGCPPQGSACGPLTAYDIWYLSWSGAAYPVPEIYRTDKIQAKQWKWLSNYSVATMKSSYFTFEGVMTQYNACLQRGNCANGTPGATNNFPGTGWQQLYDQLTTAPTVGGGIYNNPTDIQWKVK